MRRLTGLVVTGLCVCGSAAAQSGNPLVVPGPRSAAHPTSRLADPAEGLEPATISPRAAGRAFGDEGFSPRATGVHAHDETGTMLRRRLLAIGRLRAAAMENGDVELLEQADRLEQQARLELHTHAAAGASSSPSISSFPAAGRPHTHGAAEVSSGPTHRTAAYEYDPAANAQAITPASGHPIGGFRHDSSAVRSGDTGEFGLPASVNLGAGERDFGDSNSGEARFYSRRRNASELPRSNDGLRSNEPADAWYGAQSHRPPQSQPVAADPRIEDRGFGPSPAGRRVEDSRLEPHPSHDSPFAVGGIDRHPGAETRAGGNPFALPHSMEPAAPSGASPGTVGSAENPFAAFHAEPKPAIAEPAQTEFPAGRYGARSSDSGQRSGLQFETGTSGGGSSLTGRPFGQQTAAETHAPGRDSGLPGSAAPPRRGLVYGSQPESALPGRRPGLPSSMDAMQYYGRDLGRATTAEGRAAGRDFGLTTASGTRSRIPIESPASSDDPFGDMPGTSIGGGLDTRADLRRDPAPIQQTEPAKPEKRKRGLFSWFRRRGDSEK